jgi:prepilin-type N-terminal cleavage/methylation domain-containing protein
MHPSKTSRKRRRGFTLIELLVSMVVFMIGMMGIMGLQLASASGGRNAQDVSVATNLGASKLEELRLAAFGGLSDGSQTYKADGSDGTPAYFTVAWTVSGTAPKTIDLTVQWVRQSSPKSIQLSTQLAQGTVTK